jgi:ketosteroid isomerase-like protein
VRFKTLLVLAACVAAPLAHAQDAKREIDAQADGDNVRVILEIFRAVENRDDARFRELCNPKFEIHWPPSLQRHHKGRTWTDTWTPLQPTPAERRMDPHVVAASGDEVVVLWHQRGLSPTGERIDVEVLGRYQLRAKKLLRAQMFYFDTTAVGEFLGRATENATPRK